jgi:hypothetical protein
MRINPKATAAIASAVFLTAGGGVAYAADSCPGMGGSSSSTPTTTTTASTPTTTTTASSDSVRKHTVRHHAGRHAGRQ